MAAVSAGGGTRGGDTGRMDTVGDSIDAQNADEAGGDGAGRRATENGGTAAAAAAQLCLAGLWEEDPERSDSLAPLLTALGIPWVARKLILSVQVVCAISHDARELTLEDRSSLATAKTSVPRTGEQVESTGPDGVSLLRLVQEPAAATIEVVLPKGKGTTLDRRSLMSAGEMLQEFKLLQEGKPDLELRRVFVRAKNEVQPADAMTQAQVEAMHSAYGDGTLANKKPAMMHVPGTGGGSADGQGGGQGASSGGGAGQWPTGCLAGVWQVDEEGSESMNDWYHALGINDVGIQFLTQCEVRTWIRHSSTHFVVTDSSMAGETSTAFTLGTPSSAFEAMRLVSDDHEGELDLEPTQGLTKVSELVLAKAINHGDAVVIATRINDGLVSVDERKLIEVNKMQQRSALVKDGKVVCTVRRNFRRLETVEQPAGAVAGAYTRAGADEWTVTVGEAVSTAAFAELSAQALAATEENAESPADAKKLIADWGGDVVHDSSMAPTAGTPGSTRGTVAGGRPRPSRVDISAYRVASFLVLAALYFSALLSFVLPRLLLLSTVLFACVEVFLRTCSSKSSRRKVKLGDGTGDTPGAVTT